MAKTDNDRAYERGVEDGQEANVIDQLSHNFGTTFNISERDDIYDKGYRYGVLHQNDKNKQPHEDNISN